MGGVGKHEQGIFTTWASPELLELAFALSSTHDAIEVGPRSLISPSHWSSSSFAPSPPLHQILVANPDPAAAGQTSPHCMV